MKYGCTDRKHKKSLPKLAVSAVKRNSLLSRMERVTSQTAHREEEQLGFRLQCVDSWRNRQHCTVVEGISGWHYREIKSNKLQDVMATDESLSSARVDVSIQLLKSKQKINSILLKLQ